MSLDRPVGNPEEPSKKRVPAETDWSQPQQFIRASLAAAGRAERPKRFGSRAANKDARKRSSASKFCASVRTTFSKGLGTATLCRLAEPLENLCRRQINAPGGERQVLHCRGSQARAPVDPAHPPNHRQQRRSGPTDHRPAPNDSDRGLVPRSHEVGSRCPGLRRCHPPKDNIHQNNDKTVCRW